MREGSNERRQQQYLDARLEAMQKDHDGRELLARLECAMCAWACFFGPTGFCAGLAHENNKRALHANS